MANSSTVLAFAGVAPITNLGVAPSLAIPDNCGTIILRNDSSVTLLFGQGTAGTALVAGTNAGEVGPGQALTLAVGTIAVRGSMTGAAQIVYGSGGGGAATTVILYLCEFGG
jgi:hypothetical protein